MFPDGKDWFVNPSAAKLQKTKPSKGPDCEVATKEIMNTVENNLGYYFEYSDDHNTWLFRESQPPEEHNKHVVKNFPRFGLSRNMEFETLK